MRKPVLTILGIILLVVIISGAGLWFYSRISSPPSAALPLMVTFTRPEMGGSYPISGAIPIHGKAISGVPIAKLELWADGNLVDTVQPPIQNIYVFGNTWDWTPRTLGDHTLVLRAYDTQGLNTTSRVLHITGVPDPGMIDIVTAFYGDTLDSLATKYHTSVAEILAVNQGLNPNGPILGDIFIPVPPPNDLNGNSSEQDHPSTTADQPNTYYGDALALASWFQLQVIQPIESLFAPTAPQLSAAVSECNVQLSINDASNNENGFYIYRLDPQTSQFSKIGSLPSHSGSDAAQYIDQNLFGAYQYFVSAYDNAGENPSNFVQVEVGQNTCLQTVDIFTPAQLINYAKLMDKVYFYLSVNQGDWKRIPQNEFEFLAPDTVINLSKTASLLVKQPAPHLSVKGEMWGWNNGTLTFLGTFDKNVAPPSQPLSAPDFALPGTTLYVRKNNPAGPGSNEPYVWVDQNKLIKLSTETFKWATGADGVTGGQWQVSSVPFTHNLDPNPPGLLLTGQAPMPPKGDFVEFPIDLSSLSPNAIPTVQSPNAGNEKGSLTPNFSKLPPFAPPFHPIRKNRNPLQAIQDFLGFNPSKPISSVSTSGLNNPFNQKTTTSPSGVTSQDLFIRYYVRILPMNADQAVGDPSNMVILDYYWQQDKVVITLPPPPVKPYELTITDVQPIHFPLSGYEFCFTIVKNPYYDDTAKFNQEHNPFEGPLYAQFPLNSHHCPPRDTGHTKSWLEVMVDGFKEILNQTSWLYDKLTEIVVKIVELNPFCLQAEAAADAAGKGTQTVQDVCHAAAVIAVEAAKSYVGLPPSIPNYDQLQGMGEDYLADLAAQELESNGVPCPEDCRNLIKQGIHDTYEEAKASFSNSACMSTEEAEQNGFKNGICLPEGVTSKPDPRGQYSDGIVTVQVTRKPGYKDTDIPPICSLDVTGSANNSLWVGHTLSLSGPYNTYGKMMDWQGAPLSDKNAIVNRNGVGIPKLSENQSLSIPVVISRNYQPYWIPGHETLWAGYTPGPYDDDWSYLYHGAKLELAASSLCADQPSNTFTIGPVVGPIETMPVK